MNERCPYGSGKPLWLTLSSFHPPATSIAADLQVVALKVFQSEMGHHRHRSLSVSTDYNYPVYPDLQGVRVYLFLLL